MNLTMLLIALGSVAVSLASRFHPSRLDSTGSWNTLQTDPVQTSTSSVAWYQTLAAVSLREPHRAGTKYR